MPKSSQHKVIDPSGKAIRPLRYGRQNRLHTGHHIRVPTIAIIVVLTIAFLFLIPPIQPRSQIKTSVSTSSPDDGFVYPTMTLKAQPTEEHGGMIVFTCTRKDINQLCIIHADGTGYRQITDHQAHYYYPVFYKGSNTILYASNLFGSFDIYMMMLGNAKTYQLTNGIGNAFDPKPSPDGNQILFINKPGAGFSSLWIMDATGKNPRVLYTGSGSIVGSTWSPDGKTIAFVMANETSENYEVFTFDKNARIIAPRPITQDLEGLTGSLDWSHDGKFLLVCYGPMGDKDIYRLDVATGTSEPLTDGGNNAAAAYSPDDQWIVFNSLRNDGQADLFIMQANGTYQRQLTDNPEPDWQPRWGP